MSFTEIPVIDLNLAFDPATKSQFLLDLRHAIINVGFLLLKGYEETGPNDELLQKVKQTAVEFFALPEHTKLRTEMINSPHFLGYTRLANEVTASHTDWREQIDLATELPAPGPGEPVYRNIEGPNQWPDANAIPTFRPVIEEYIARTTNLSTVFRGLVMESIGLYGSVLDVYFKPNQQCKMKLIAYPDSQSLEGKKSVALNDTSSTNQGVGPHRDSDLLTYIFQATEHTDSLQVQNFQGEWITVPNIPHTLVVNAGQTLEAITQGVCKATIHRVLSPKPGTGTRISVPFFQTIDLDSHKSLLKNIPREVLDLKDTRDKNIKNWAVDVGFQYTPDVDKDPVGYYVFRNRIKSHQDVAKKWYPEILTQVLQEYSR